MKSAKLEVLGWMGTMVHEFSGDSWTDVYRAFNDFQDVGCLMHQVYMMGTAQDREGIVGFEAFVNKWRSGDLTKEDFSACRAALSIGHICCLSAADENGEVTFPEWKD